MREARANDRGSKHRRHHASPPGQVTGEHASPPARGKTTISSSDSARMRAVFAQSRQRRESNSNAAVPTPAPKRIANSYTSVGVSSLNVEEVPVTFSRGQGLYSIPECPGLVLGTYPLRPRRPTSLSANSFTLRSRPNQPVPGAQRIAPFFSQSAGVPERDAAGRVSGQIRHLEAAFAGIHDVAIGDPSRARRRHQFECARIVFVRCQMVLRRNRSTHGSVSKVRPALTLRRLTRGRPSGSSTHTS